MTEPDLVELGAGEGDLRRLRRFYDEIYVNEFPDPNERESVENIIAYLRGRPGPGRYHVVLALADDHIVGGSICDYLTDAHAGAIEFLVVDPALRGHGIGSRLVQATEERLVDDARACGTTLRMIGAEIDDPFRPPKKGTAYDPFERIAFWGKRHYAKLDFPYLQPALSADQRPVENLLLCAKRPVPVGSDVPVELVDAFLRNYLQFAMQIHPPERAPEYRVMQADLRNRPTVRAIPLQVYAAGRSR